MVPSTSVAAGTAAFRSAFSPVVWASALATGRSLLPVTVMVTVAGVLTPESMSVAV